jgi:hypothetical protein
MKITKNKLKKMAGKIVQEALVQTAHWDQQAQPAPTAVQVPNIISIPLGPSMESVNPAELGARIVAAIKARQGVHTAPGDVTPPSPIPAAATPAVKPCRCREFYMGFAEPAHVETVVQEHAKVLPGVFVEAIHQRGQAMGLSGMVSAADVVAGENGRGELAFQLSKSPVIRELSNRIGYTIVQMDSHGGNITKDDKVTLIGTFLSSFLVYALTDMNKPSCDTN